MAGRDGSQANPDKDGRIEHGRVELSKTEARAGMEPHVVRYVLGISLLLAVIAMLFVLFPAD